MAAPQTTPIVEHRHNWGFLVWDPSDGIVTRGEATFAAPAADVYAGTVIAKIVGAAAAVALDTNTGNGTFGTITPGPTAQAGVYTVEFDDATHFVLSNPEGIEIAHGTTGVAVSGDLGFTITAGGTAFAPGDSFQITVQPGSGDFVAWDPTGATGAGSEVVAGVLGTHVPTSPDNVVAGALLRGPARINSSELLWGANVTTQAQQLAALASLAALGIQATSGAGGLAAV